MFTALQGSPAGRRRRIFELIRSPRTALLACVQNVQNLCPAPVPSPAAPVPPPCHQQSCLSTPSPRAPPPSTSSWTEAFQFLSLAGGPRGSALEVRAEQGGKTGKAQEELGAGVASALCIFLPFCFPYAP